MFWTRLLNTTEFVSNFLSQQNMTDCFGSIVSPDCLLLKCMRAYDVIDVKLIFSYNYI